MSTEPNDAASGGVPSAHVGDESDEMTAVLVVGDWTTKCSACGDDCDPAETHHRTVLPGFSRAESMRGCGARFVAMRRSSSARIVPGLPSCGHIADLRPDLPVEAS